MQDLIQKVDIQRIAREGAKLYAEIMPQYDPKEKGKFLALDIESKEVFLASSSAKALEAARQRHPGQVFYVVKVGYEAAET